MILGRVFSPVSLCLFRPWYGPGTRTVTFNVPSFWDSFVVASPCLFRLVSLSCVVFHLPVFFLSTLTKDLKSKKRTQRHVRSIIWRCEKLSDTRQTTWVFSFWSCQSTYTRREGRSLTKSGHPPLRVYWPQYLTGMITPRDCLVIMMFVSSGVQRFNGLTSLLSERSKG